MAGAAGQADYAAAADRGAGGGVPCLRGACRADDGGGAGDADGGIPAVYSVLRAAGAVPRPADAQPDMDAGDHPHQTERLRGHRPVRRLGVRGGAGRRLPAGGLASGRGMVSGLLRRRHTVGVPCAVSVAEEAGRRSAGGAVSIQKTCAVLYVQRTFFAWLKGFSRRGGRWRRSWSG